MVYVGVSSDAFQKAVATTAPAIFSADASGKGQAAINNSDGSLNSSTNPATPGSFITFYVTGEGQTNPPGSDGNIAVSGTANVTAQVSVPNRRANREGVVRRIGTWKREWVCTGQCCDSCLILAIRWKRAAPHSDRKRIQSETSGNHCSDFGIAQRPFPNAPLGVRRERTAVKPNTRVGWTAADVLATHFHVEKQTAGSVSFAEIGVVASTVLAFTDLSVVPGTTYAYRVRAEDDYGLFPVLNRCQHIHSLHHSLRRQQMCKAVAASQTQVNLIWSAANTNATSFQIERKTGTAGTYAVLVTLPSTATAYQDTTVAANTVYVFRMRSQGSSGLSAYSTESTVTTPAVPLPTAPTMTATALSSSQIQLSWTSTATGVIRFRIERRTLNGSIFRRSIGSRVRLPRRSVIPA